MVCRLFVGVRGWLMLVGDEEFGFLHETGGLGGLRSGEGR